MQFSLDFYTPIRRAKTRKACCKKYKPCILKYKALILKYVPYILNGFKSLKNCKIKKTE